MSQRTNQLLAAAYTKMSPERRLAVLRMLERQAPALLPVAARARDIKVSAISEAIYHLRVGVRPSRNLWMD